MQMDINEKIIEIVSSFKQLPYLFVGTGISRRYANAPDWDGLLYSIWSILNPSQKENDYKRFKLSIESDIENSSNEFDEDVKKYYINPVLATKMSLLFNKSYYNDSVFRENIFTSDEDKEILDNNYDPFKFYISKEINLVHLTNSNIDYHELESLIENKNKFAGIITTNYDSIIEDILPDFTTMIGQDNMLLSNSLNIFEIFKIHGCASNPNSIVITKDDYDKFNRKLKYLSAKLLTIFVEHPIIFIGYSFNDVNIRKLFEEISNCLTPEQLSKIKNNFIFITKSSDNNESIIQKELNFNKNRIIMNEFILRDYSKLYKSFSNIQSSLPIKLARKLQDMVCNYVYSSEATNNILFGSIDSPDIDENKAAIYFGRRDIIQNIGFSHFTIDDILEDILFDNKPYLKSEQLITKTFKNIRSNFGQTLLPVYKYIYFTNYDICKLPENYKIIRSYNDVLPTKSEIRNFLKNDFSFKNIADIESAFPHHILKQVSYIKKNAKNISSIDLERYLKKHYNDKETYNRYLSTFRKLIALYDFKKYNELI